jgi:uncharacterized phage protein (TIGR01671 family)
MDKLEPEESEGMREIKFRGKRVDNGKWVYGDLIHEKYGTCIQYIETEYPKGNGAPERKLIFKRHKTTVIPATIGQYTGLRDKNGKEIYEGDIIVGTYKDMGTDTGLVVFKGCGFKVEIPNVGDDELVDWERYSDSIEVIGNIYENPELLKEAQTSAK